MESLTSNNTNKTSFSESMISMSKISKGGAIQPSPPVDSSFCRYVIILTFMLKNRLDRDQHSEIFDV